ncbi:MAG: T9SS type A sorting domain-containing protein [Lutibacter sp.]|nr:T9SS type A sorting domain-containing protein [Lutibacter sp.]MBP9600009.1 T9SS type A sorting domain-containing protein [Lutibacter sp.]
MKKTLLFTTKKLTFYSFLAFCLCFNYGYSQTNLVLNGNCEAHTVDQNDNADSFDMTPPSTLDGLTVGGVVTVPYVASPYTWNNSDLDNWLYVNCGNSTDGNEQPGSSSDGNKFGPDAGTGRGVKIASTCRRLYQVVPVTIGTTYTFSIDSRSEWASVPSEVFILNTEIADEAGLTSSSTTVDGYKSITNDFNATKSSSTEDTFTTTTISFTATTSIAVIYVRAPQAVSSTTEVFYDNIKLFDPSTASVKENFATNFSLYPNPSKGFINIQSKNVEISKVQLFTVTGQKVLEQKGLVNGGIDVSKFAKGIYVLKIESGDKFYTNKVIVE